MPESAAELIRSTEKPGCYLCGAEGLTLYANLPDRLGGTPGLWNLKKCPNSACGLIWLDPMPLPEDIGKAYANYYTHAAPSDKNKTRNLKRVLMDAYLAQNLGYPATKSAWQKAAGLSLSAFPWIRNGISRSVAWLPFKPGGRLLDVGCGSGAFLLSMRRLGWQVEGVEVDAAAVAQARSQGLVVRCGFLEEHFYPDGTFDAITLMHVIEHVHTPIELLIECFRLLKKGGRLVITTPNCDSWAHKIFRENWQDLDPPRHLYLFSPKSMRLLAEKARSNQLIIRTNIGKASAIYLTSKSLEHTGVLIRTTPNPLIPRIESKIFSIVEHWRLKQDPSVGEELILIGGK